MKTKIVNSPISDLFILSKSGTPLFARSYVEAKFQADSVLLAGFLSAIEIFTTNNLQGQLTDLGLGDRRYFFGRSTRGFVFVVSSVQTIPLYIEKTLADIAKTFLDKIRIAFDLVDDMANQLNVDINMLTTSFGDTLDSLLFESTVENTDLNEQLDTMAIRSISGEEITRSDLESMLNTINEKTRLFLESFEDSI